jgi:hypothetical protein
LDDKNGRAARACCGDVMATGETTAALRSQRCAIHGRRVLPVLDSPVREAARDPGENDGMRLDGATIAVD